MSFRGIKYIKCTVLYVSPMTVHFHLLSSSLWPCNRYKEYEPVSWIFILLHRVFGTRPYYPYSLLAYLKSHLNRVGKFLKSRIRKFSDNQNLLHLRTFRKCGSLRICDFRTQYFLRCVDLRFADPILCGLPQIRKFFISVLCREGFLFLPCNN